MGDGDRRICTVLFTDVSGFTAMSEKLDPEAVSGIMNAFFEVLTRCIYRYGGTVDKYIGDAIMALFGAPIAHEDDAERAVGAAWDMQATARQFAADLADRTGIELKIRIGINTGLVVAGSVGGAEKRDYTVLGDTVNLASRLESNCRPGSVLVSRETQRLARRAYFFTPLDPIKVKGKADFVDVFEVAGLRSRLTEGDERPPFTGRTREIQALQQAYSTLQDTGVGVALLVGEAGIGKSRLAGEFERHATQTGAAVIKARCFSYEQTQPYSLVAHLLTEGLQADTAPVQLVELCQAAKLPSPHQAAQALGHMLGHVLDDPELTSLSAGQLRSYVERTLNALLRSRSAGRPIVLSLVDLHWGDSASVGWLESAIEEFTAHSAPIFFLLQVRPEGEAAIRLPTHGLRLRLEPLGDRDGLAIVEGLLEAPVAGEAGRLAHEALARAEGNPFYLCELVRTLIEQNLLVRQGDGWGVRTTTGLTLPSTIQGTIAARVDTLPDPARQTLQVASVTGRRTPKALLATLLQDNQIEAQLAELVAAELVHLGTDDQIVFNQALILEVVYEGLLVRTRKALHRLVGLALERSVLDRAAIAAILARHFEKAEDDERCARYSHLAAQRAAERFANAEARDASLTALAALTRLESPSDDRPTPETVLPEHPRPSRAQLLLLLGDAEASLGSYDEALGAYGRALEETDPTLRTMIHRALGSVLDQRGDYAGATAAYQAALVTANDAGQRGMALGLLAHIAYRQADYALAIAHCQEAIGLLDPTSHPKEIAQAHSVLGLCQWRMGHLTEADAHHRRALSLRETAQDVYGIGASLTNLAQIGSELGQWRQALGLANQALALYERIGDPQRICSGAMVVGGLAMDLGEYETAKTHLQRSLQQARQIGHPLSTALSLANLGDLAIRQQRPQDAIADLQAAVGILERLGGKGHLAQALLLLGTALTLVNQHQPAWQALTRGLELADAAGEKGTQGAACHRIARFYLQAGQLDEALTWAGKGVAILQEAQYQQELGHGYMQLAEVFAAQGNTQMRDQASQRAVAIFERIGAEHEARRARELLALT